MLACCVVICCVALSPAAMEYSCTGALLHGDINASVLPASLGVQWLQQYAGDTVDRMIKSCTRSSPWPSLHVRLMTRASQCRASAYDRILVNSLESQHCTRAPDQRFRSATWQDRHLPPGGVAALLPAPQIAGASDLPDSTGANSPANSPRTSSTIASKRIVQQLGRPTTTRSPRSRHNLPNRPALYTGMVTSSSAQVW